MTMTRRRKTWSNSTFKLNTSYQSYFLSDIVTSINKLSNRPSRSLDDKYSKTMIFSDKLEHNRLTHWNRPFQHLAQLNQRWKRSSIKYTNLLLVYAGWTKPSDLSSRTPIPTSHEPKCLLGISSLSYTLFYNYALFFVDDTELTFACFKLLCFDSESQ